MNPPNGTTTVASCPLRQDSGPPSIPPITVKAHVFFDGTGNNRANTAHRTANTLTYRLIPALLGDSYENDASNVSRLEACFSITDANSFSIYVEGIGTQSGGMDVVEGMAFGTGVTGVPAKVVRACSQVYRQITSRVQNRQAPLSVELYAFGFSRGAAAARYFVHKTMEDSSGFWRTPLATRLSQAGYNVQQVQFKLLGLFDTVSSYDINHDDDVRELHLDCLSHVQQVIHLAAANEHRANFALTDVTSAGSKIELYLPGVHSDIGGGYTDGFTETRLVLYKLNPIYVIPTVRERCRQAVEAERNRLINEGWYRASQLDCTDFEIAATRTVAAAYNRIPLLVMSNLASEFGVSFTGVAGQYPIPAGLTTAKNQIEQYVATKRGGGSLYTDWEGAGPPWLQTVRNQYFHSSAHYTTTLGIIESMRPQFHSARHGWDDHFEARLTGRRKRRVYHG